MAELQTITAVVHIVQLASSTIDLVRRICKEADIEAQGLVESTNHISHLAECVSRRLKERASKVDNVQQSDFELTVCEAISESLGESNRALRSIQDQLRPFTENETPPTFLKKLFRNAEFVRSEDRRKAHISTIQGHINSLTLSVGLLNSHDLQTLSRHLAPTNGARDQSINPRAIAHQHLEAVPKAYNGQQLAIERRQTDEAIAAIVANDAVALQHLIQSGLNVTLKDEHEWTLLHHAAKRLNLRVFEELLNAPQAREPGFLNAFSSLNQTALMVIADQASEAESFHLALALLRRNCSINLKDGLGRSALWFALDAPVDCGRVNFVSLLWRRGADRECLVNHPNFERFRPMSLHPLDQVVVTVLLQI